MNMVELKEKASSYAEENVLEVLKEAFAKVYADGYRDGYKDREGEIPVDLRTNQTKYIDLGLPSGTLWSADYEKDGDDNLYLSYEMASVMNLPTKEQWKELKGICKWEYLGERLEKIKCVGPNGNYICFNVTGYLDFVRKLSIDEVYFWIKEADNRYAVRMWKYQYGREEVEGQNYSNKLPVRLVK